MIRKVVQVLATLLVLAPGGVAAWRILKFEMVPLSVRTDDTVRITTILERSNRSNPNERLYYSAKWFHGTEEFLKSVPTEQRHCVMFYPNSFQVSSAMESLEKTLEGVLVKIHFKIWLKIKDLRARGNYSFVLTEEAPSFNSLTESMNLTVETRPPSTTKRSTSTASTTLIHLIGAMHEAAGSELPDVGTITESIGCEDGTYDPSLGVGLRTPTQLTFVLTIAIAVMAISLCH